RGVPLTVRLTGANRNDSQDALALVDAIPPLHGEWGRPRQRPDCVLGDRGDDYDPSGVATERRFLPEQVIAVRTRECPHQADRSAIDCFGADRTRCWRHGLDVAADRRRARSRAVYARIAQSAQEGAESDHATCEPGGDAAVVK